jgi:hypothetical protein
MVRYRQREETAFQKSRGREQGACRLFSSVTHPHSALDHPGQGR